MFLMTDVLYLVFLVTWAIVIAVFFNKGHYIAATCNFIIGCYELSGLFFYFVSVDAEFSIAQSLYERFLTREEVYSFIVHLFLSFMIANLFYVALLNIQPTKGMLTFIYKRSTQAKGRGQLNYFILYSFVLAMGLISMATQSGEAWRKDYDYQNQFFSTTISPAHHYGKALLPLVIVLLFDSMLKRKYRAAFLQSISILPISYEIFISGRRHSFVPSIIVFFLLALYSQKIPNKRRLLTFFTGIAVGLLTMQFMLRADYYVAVYRLQGASAVFKPFLGEFVAVGATTVNSFILIADKARTYGIHLFLYLIDSFPFIKTSDALVSLFQLRLWSDYKLVSPFGGFSMLADMYLAFGSFGFILFSSGAAIFVAFSHKVFVEYSSDDLLVNRRSLFLFGLIALAITQYRVGASSSIKVIIAYIILFLFIDLLSRIYSAVNRSDKHDTSSVAIDQ